MEIVDLPSYKMVIFHSFLYVYQRVPLGSWHEPATCCNVFHSSWKPNHVVGDDTTRKSHDKQKNSLRAVRIARLGRPSWCMTPKICSTLVRARISLGLIWVNDSPHLGTCALPSNRPSGLNDAPYSHSPWTWVCINSSLRHPHCLQKWMPPPGALL